MRKAKLIMLSLVTMLLIPSVSFASNGTLYGAGEWDPVGEETFNGHSSIYNSGGGNFMLCRDTYINKYDTSINVKIYEWDPVSDNDYITTISLTRGDCDSFSVSDFVDGGDQAEIQAVSDAQIHTTFWD